jgi:hypothetical protein
MRRDTKKTIRREKMVVGAEEGTSGGGESIGPLDIAWQLFS